MIFISIIAISSLFTLATTINHKIDHNFDHNHDNNLETQKYHLVENPQDLQLAYITPLDINGNQHLQSAFRGYIRLTPSLTYPSYYELLCPTPTYNVNLQSYFSALNQKLSELNENFEKILQQSGGGGSGGGGSGGGDDDDYDYLEQSQYSEYPEYPQTPNFIDRPQTNSRPSTNHHNTNTQSGIFQCEGFTCPANTQHCKIAINSVQPRNDMLRHNVFCMSHDDDMLEEFEKVVQNPNRGSVVNISKTFNPHGMQQVQDEVESKLKEAQAVREQKMKEMKEKMNKVFGKMKNVSWD
jgi:hypothetical protein